MSTNLFKVYRSGGIARPRVAPAPSDGMYVIEGDDATLVTNFARITSGGTFAWSKELSHSAGGWDTTGVIFPQIASNSTHVAIMAIAASADTAGIGSFVALYDADGTLVWQTFLPLINDLDAQPSNSAQYAAGFLALAADNSVFVHMGASGADDSVILKLNASTGAQVWAVNMRETSSPTGDNYSGALALLSGGDLVAHVRDTTKCYVQRLSGSDGSVVWSKGVVWASGNLNAGVCVDPSDDIYVVGRQHSFNPCILPVVKLDSSGSTLWNRNITCPAGLSSLAINFKWSGGLTADASGVYIASALNGSTNKMGHVFVPAAGTVATGTALLATFTKTGNSIDAIYSASHAGGPSVFAYRDQTAPSTGDIFGIVVASGSSSGEDGTWGAYTRLTRAYDVANGGATISTQTYTRASLPTVTSYSFTAVESAGTLSAENYLPVYNVTALAPATQFGTPNRAGYGTQDPYTVSTVFGTPHLYNEVFPTSVGPLTIFGTGAYLDDRSVTATGLAAGTMFGLGWAERDPLPGSPTTVAAAPSTAFGTPAVNGAAAVTAEGASTTAFGTPVSGWVCPVTGFAVGAFGTPTLSNPVRATSLAPATAFGLGMTAGFGGTTGAAPSTAFGLPAATFGAVGNATGATSTAFGTPSTLNNRQRTRSGVFRTQWGVAQAERTAP